MAFTQSDVDKLDAARRAGTSRVRFSDGREVQFDSVDDYIKLRNLMMNEVSATGVKPVRMIKTYTDSGW